MNRRRGRAAWRDFMPVRRRSKRREAKSSADSEWGRDLLGDGMMDFTPEELREFLEGDLSEVEVRPEFKERLRKKL